MNKVTLKSLAKALELSVSTVSKALNDSYEISESTKVRVREYADKLDYQPNIIAQHLKTGKTNTIGVIIPKMSNPFAAQIIEGIQKEVVSHNYHMVIMQSMENEAIEKAAIQGLLNKGVDGLLFCPISETSNIELVSRAHKNTPIVLFDRTNYQLPTHKVGVLNADGVYQACKQLFELNRKRIAIICGRHQGITKERLHGYQLAHKNHQIPVVEEYLIYCKVDNLADLDLDLEQQLDKLLALPNPPDAVIGVTDTITTHLLGVLSKMAIVVPEKLAVIGFANTELAFALNPSLSTIKQPAEEIGVQSVRKLLHIINSKNRSQIEWEDLKLPTQIQLRNSTAVS